MRSSNSNNAVVVTFPALLLPRGFSATLLLMLVAVRNVQAFSLITTLLTTPAKRLGSTTTTTYASKATTFTTILDGPCWESLQDFLYKSSPSSSSSSSTFSRRPKAGILTVMTGTLKNDDDKTTTRVVGIPVSRNTTTPNNKDDGESTSSSSSFVILESGEALLADSVARIPNSNKISDTAVATTYINVVTHVHTLCTIVKNVGTTSPGSSSNFVNIPKKVVVLGGHDDAVNAAKAWSILGSNVTIVSTKKDINIGTGNAGSNKKKIATLTPATTGGAGELGFADVVGKFDALLDTIGNEVPTSSVVRLLQKLHDCNTYVSVCSGAEQVIAREGLLFGPNKAKQHMQQLVNGAATAAASNSKNRDKIDVIKAIPKIGSTVETLLEAGFVWGSTSGNSGGIVGGLLNNINAKSTTTSTSSTEPQARGWSMAAAWEATTWPRDTAGNGNVRFGLPVVQGRFPEDSDDDDDDDDDEESGGRMIAKPPLTARRRQLDEQEEVDEEAQNDDPMDLPVMQISGMKGLNRQILARNDQNVILFLSAPFCRTCRRLTTPYTRMARDNKRAEKQHKPQVPLVFAKADASGLEGKTLGRALSVVAVPAFVLFQNGKRYGSTLSVSKIPSEQLDMALEYLRDGRPWDDDAFRPQNTGRQTSLKER